MRNLSLVLLMGAATSSFAYAQSFNDQIVNDLQSKGFEYIEIETGRTQTKVEAVRGSDKLEVVYDRSTGEILKQERERADADYANRSGVEITTRDRDFLDEDEDEDRGRDEDDDDDDDRDDEDHDRDSDGDRDDTDGDDDDNDEEDEDEDEEDDG